MQWFFLPKDVAKKLRNAKKAAGEAANDQLQAEREATKRQFDCPQKRAAKEGTEPQVKILAARKDKEGGQAKNKPQVKSKATGKNKRDTHPHAHPPIEKHTNCD